MIQWINYSNKNQTVSPADSKRLYQAILKHLNLKKPNGIEKDIAEDFLSWLSRRDEDGSIIDIPGFYDKIILLNTKILF